MKKYFIIDGFRRLGPFDVADLKVQNITPQTIIWTFEEGEKSAIEFAELAECFGSENIKKENIKKEDLKTDNNQKEKEQKLLEEYEKLKKEKEEKQKIEEQQKNITPPPQPIIEFQKDIPQENLYNEVDNENVDEDEENFDDITSEEQKQDEFKIEENNYQTSQNTSYSNSFQTKFNNYSTTSAKKPLYFGLSLLNLLFCCLPLGIVAIIFSSNAKKAFDAGDIEMGNQKAGVALIINIVSMIVGLIFWIIVIANAK